MQSIETSALLGVNVDKAFDALVRLAVERVQQRTKNNDDSTSGAKNGEAVVLDGRETRRGCC